MTIDDLDKDQTEWPTATLTDKDRSAVVHARARLRAMINRRSDQMNKIANELHDLRDEMRELDELESKMGGNIALF